MKKIGLIPILLLLLITQGQAYCANYHPLESPEAPDMFIQAPQNEREEPTKNIESIYQNLIPLDIKFENGLDPYEQQDNYSCARSPYPSLRISMRMYCKNEVIEPGYYLLTPRAINGRTYMLFKQIGKVLYSVPVFAEKQINTEQEYPQPKDPFDSAPFGLRSIWKGFGIISGRRTPMPKTPQCKLDCFAYDDQYYGINVYYKDKLYKTVYKIKLYE